jgi:hypothetical protein
MADDPETPPPMQFCEGEIRAWDPLRRELQIGDMVLILAPDVPVNGLAVGRRVYASGERDPRREPAQNHLPLPDGRVVVNEDQMRGGLEDRRPEDLPRGRIEADRLPSDTCTSRRSPFWLSSSATRKTFGDRA